jgi:hypothetical protein
VLTGPVDPDRALTLALTLGADADLLGAVRADEFFRVRSAASPLDLAHE